MGLVVGSCLGLDIPKIIIKCTTCARLLAWHAGVRVTGSFAVQPDYIKDQLVYMCGTVYGDTHLKDPVGSIARVWQCISFPEFYVVANGRRCQKNTLARVFDINHICDVNTMLNFSH